MRLDNHYPKFVKKLDNMFYNKTLEIVGKQYISNEIRNNFSYKTDCTLLLVRENNPKDPYAIGIYFAKTDRNSTYKYEWVRIGWVSAVWSKELAKDWPVTPTGEHVIINARFTKDSNNRYFLRHYIDDAIIGRIWTE